MKNLIMKGILAVVLVLFFVPVLVMPGKIAGQGTTVNTSPSKIVGYVTYKLDPAVKLNQLSSVIWEGVTPKSAGNMTLTRLDNGPISDCVAVINACHTAGIPCVMEVYAPWNRPAYNNAFTNAKYKTQLINNIVNLVAQYGFDGIDMDWECDSDPGLNSTIYAQYYADLRVKLPSPKTIGITTTYAKVVLPPSAQTYLDTISIIVYDCGTALTWYGTMSDVEAAMKLWIDTGFSNTKLLLGINFAARYQKGGGWFSWKYVVDTYNPPAPATTAGKLCFNGIDLTVKKAQWAMTNIAGVFCYEVNLDKMNDNRSLLQNIYNTFNTVTGVTQTTSGHSSLRSSWNAPDLSDFRPLKILP
jgi:chitinase